MKTRRLLVVLVLVLSHALAVAGGVAYTIRWHLRDVLNAGNFATQVSAVGYALLATKVQLENTGCDGAERALLELDSVMAEYSADPSAFFSQQIYQQDRALIFTRLAQIARQKGDGGNVAKYSGIAEGACQKAEWRECSLEHLEATVARLTAHDPVACLPPIHPVRTVE